MLSPNTYSAGFFAEEVRRELSERYGEKKLYEGGLSVRTTLDPKMQADRAQVALVDGLVRYDEAHGYRGPMRHIDITGDWGPPLANVPALGDVAAVAARRHPRPQRHGSARVGLQPKQRVGRLRWSSRSRDRHHASGRPEMVEAATAATA